MGSSRIEARQQWQCPQGSPKILCLIADPFKNSVKLNAFWASLGSSLGITLLIAILFSLLRPYNNLVYAPKVKNSDERHAPPTLGRGIFAWVRPIVKIREPDFVDKIGMDATIFLRFTRMCRNIFLVLSVIGCLVMIPVNRASSQKSIATGQNAFFLMTPLFVWGPALWAHVVCSYLFNICIAFFLWRNYRAVTSLRRRYFDSPEYQMSLHARSLMVTQIPANSRSDEGVEHIVEKLGASPEHSRSIIGRNTKELPKLVEEHQQLVRKLESFLAKYLKNPDNLPTSRPRFSPPKSDKAGRGEKVDAISYLRDRIRLLEDQILHVRKNLDSRNALPYGFTSLDTVADAHILASAARRKHPEGATIQLAPAPKDIIWDNLPFTKSHRRWKKVRNQLWIALLTIVWIAPNSMMALFLSNLANLAEIWPAFRIDYYANPKTWAAVEGIASPAITSLIYLILPIIFRRLSIRAGDLTKSSREKHVVHNLYAFFVFNNLFIFSCFAAIWTYVAAVIEKGKKDSLWKAIEEGKLGETVFVALCNVSPFWITWLLQRNLGAAVDLSQGWNLFAVWFARTFMNPTPRQMIEWTAPPPFDYASYYNYFLFYATVALAFATLQPLVLLVTAFYFTLDSWLKKYLLLYVFITKTESGGLFWRVVFNRLIFAAIGSNVVVGLIVYVRGANPGLMAGVMVPAPLLMLAFKWYCRKTFDDQTHYFATSVRKDVDRETVSAAARKNERLATRFGHPALTKKLITPMVHAKAENVLKDLLNDDRNRGMSVGGDHRDIQLSGMSRTNKGKGEVQNNRGFEVVPEAKLDFAYFKDRPEFSEEHGGGLYGNPSDLVSERSQTPRSHLGGGFGSPESSRPGTPTGYGPRPVPFRPGTANSANLGIHPAYRDSPPPSRGRGVEDHLRPFPTTRSDSESRLLSGAGAMPVSTPGAREESMDRGGSRESSGGYMRWHGYGNVPQEPADDGTSYDYFRQPKR
ncbi:MAG: Transmembrane protein 63C [Vezdaea aestivalis]|nr:MAG: Transmembrane protein 63C [Vezdaea aestivalis]